MRRVYHEILKKWFRIKLIQFRDAADITQQEMAARLAMDERSYVDLEHGKACCSAVTLVLFFLFCCNDPVKLLQELCCAFESGANEVA